MGYVKDLGFYCKTNSTLKVFKRQQQEICFLKCSVPHLLHRYNGRKSMYVSRTCQKEMK